MDLTLGKNLHSEYANGEPYPHIVIDGFLESEYLDNFYQDIKNIEAWKNEEHNYSKSKFYISNYDNMPNSFQKLACYANSESMCSFLSDLTGIEGILADNNFQGGGIHCTKKDGKLGIHADFNSHPETKQHRRLNLLIYLNPNLSYIDGGCLELWDKDMSKCVKKIQPVYNRAVIFTITDNAFHGQPEPFMGDIRLSFAAYYYTANILEDQRISALWMNT